MTENNEIIFDADAYTRALGVPPPPGIPPDVVPAATVWVEQILAALVAAANSDDPKDMAELQKNFAERQALSEEALAKFPATEQESEAQLQAVSQLTQQLPQMLSGVAGAFTGALGGALKPLTEMPQQVAQQVQGLLQQGMGALGESAVDPAALEAAAFEEFGASPAEFAEEAGGGGGGGGGIGTAPMSMLGPAATPGASTTPTSSRATVMPATPAPQAVPHGPVGGMGGYPMMPPGAMRGAGGSEGGDKTPTKKVNVPSIKNGAPVTGRVTAPPTPPTVSKQVEGKTVATRRIVIPSDKTAGKAGDEPST